MSTSLCPTTITVSFLTGAVSPAQEPEQKASASLEHRFAEFDRDGDGKLTRGEFPATRNFDAADKDRDGLLTLDELRAHFRRQPAVAPKAQTASPSIRTTLDIPYDQKPGVEPRLLSLDVHAPTEAKAAPVMVYVHGGFWQAGDKSAKGHLPEFFCGKGLVFVTLNYRFARQAGDDQDPDTSIRLLGFNQEGKQIVRRLDDGTGTGRTARRLDPETLVGASEPFLYLTLVGGGRSELRLCRTGITPSTPSETPQ